MNDPWQRVMQLREEAFKATPSAHSRSSPTPMSSPSSAERQEYKMGSPSIARDGAQSIGDRAGEAHEHSAVAVNIDTEDAPKTREVLLEGLRQGLQARVAQLWSNVTLQGEPTPGPRFAEGITKAIENYEKAWKYINDVTEE